MKNVLAMLILVAGLALAADVNGTWNVTVDIQGNTGTPTFVLKQDGEKLTGNYSGLLGDAPITGTIKGDQVEWSFDVKSDQVTGKIMYRGTVSGTKMSGKLSLGDMGEGTWTATRK